MPPFVAASLGWHALAAGAALAWPGAWPWALGGVALNHALLTAAGLWPRSALLGPNVTRLPAASIARGEIALTIDDGPDDDVTPRVLDLLDRHGVRATFFCIAERAAARPSLVREIVARGHDVQNHSARHRHHFSLLGPRGFEREISRAQRLLADITGVAPTCFRAPAGLRNPFLDPVLHRLGLTLVSWTRRGFDTRERDPAKVLARLTRGLAAGDILLLHDGHAARGPGGRPVVLDVLPVLLDRCRDAGLRPVTLAEALPARRAALPAGWPALHRAACVPYRAAGRFAWHFARGKLGRDPVFRHLVEHGLLDGVASPAGERRATTVRVLDIGCGQGLLASLLDRLGAGAGGHPAARRFRYTGIDLMPRDIERARAALGVAGAEGADAPRFVRADMREAAFPPSDVAVILDVLHYVEPDAQRRVLERVRAALGGEGQGGRLLLRVGDASRGRGFAVSQWVDRAVTRVRGHRAAPTWGRPLDAWIALLADLGFSVEAVPMSRGTPFANVLLVADLALPVVPPCVPSLAA